MAGVAASRLGLWMFDLAVMRLMQDGVPDHERSCYFRNLLNFLPQLAKFRDFRTSYGFYIILKYFSGKSVVMLREEDARNLMRVRG